MNGHDQKILQIIHELILEDTLEEIEKKTHILFDLIATNPDPMDNAKLCALRNMKEAFEIMKNAQKEKDNLKWKKTLEDLKKSYQ